MGNLLTVERPICFGLSFVDAKVPVSIPRSAENERESTGRTVRKPGRCGMKYILSACPIHRECTIQVVFGGDINRRIPFPYPALKQIAERDFPGLVPIEAKHLKSDVVHSSTNI